MTAEPQNTSLIKVTTGLARIEKQIAITNKLLATIEIGKTVIIGTQEWTAENLNVSTFRNGDPIPEAESNEEWEKATDEGKPAWCYYDGDPANGEKYSKLYNWYAVNDSRGLAPGGWLIPSDEEWNILVNYLGGEEIAGIKMKSLSAWENDGNGDNSSGFTAFPAGYQNPFGTFLDQGEHGYFWSSSVNSCNHACSRYLSFYDSEVSRGLGYHEGCGFSVRCVRDL